MYNKRGVDIRGVDIRMERVRQAGVKGNGERKGKGKWKGKVKKRKFTINCTQLLPIMSRDGGSRGGGNMAMIRRLGSYTTVHSIVYVVYIVVL